MLKVIVDYFSNVYLISILNIYQIKITNMKIEEVKDIDVGFPAILYPDILSFQGNLDIYHKNNKVSYKIAVEFSFSSSE